MNVQWELTPVQDLVVSVIIPRVGTVVSGFPTADSFFKFSNGYILWLVPAYGNPSFSTGCESGFTGDGTSCNDVDECAETTDELGNTVKHENNTCHNQERRSKHNLTF